MSLLAPDLLAALAKAYEEAALAGADMPKAAVLLDRARLAAADGATPATVQRVTALLAEAIESEPLARALARFRDTIATASLQQAAARAGDDATWRDAVATAVDLTMHEQAIAIARLAPATAEQAVIAAGTEAALRSRWREAAAMFDLLGHDATVAVATRSHMLATRALIDLRIFRDTDAVRRRLAEAEAAAPGQWQTEFVTAALTGLAETQEADSAAEAGFQRADDLAHGKASSPLAELGRIMVRRGNLSRAEQCFVQATHAEDTPCEGYRCLIELAGHKTLFVDRRSRIPVLVQRAGLLALSKADVVDTMMAAAQAMHANQTEDEAAEWLARAIAEDPLRSDALLRRGYIALERGELAAARADFTRAREVCPESADVDWAFAGLAEAAKDWPAMLDASLSAMARAPDWAEAITGRLEQTARSLYGPDPQASERIVDALRAARGEAYEPVYRNLLGNLRYWHADYAAAADCYRVSLHLRPEEARYAANLAGALEKSGDADEQALAAAATALAREPDSTEYAALHTRLLATWTFVQRYGPAARALRPDTHRITVFVPTGLLGQVAPQGSLLPQVQQRIAALRQALKQQYGFTLCGVNFREMQAWEDPSASLAIEIGGHRLLEIANARADEDLLGALDRIVRTHLPLAFGHDEAHAVAKSCQHADRLNASPALLNGFTHALRVWLAGHDELPDAALSEILDKAEPLTPPAPPPVAVAPPTLGLACSADLRVTDEHLTWVQRQLFRRNGVVIPLLPLTEPRDLPPETLLLIIGTADHKLPAEQPWSAAIDLLAAQSAALLEQAAVSYALEQSRQALPMLIGVAEALLRTETLLALLRQRLEKGHTIRNLGAVWSNCFCRSLSKSWGFALSHPLIFCEPISIRWPDSHGLTAMLPLGLVLGPPSFPSDSRWAAAMDKSLVASPKSSCRMPKSKMRG